MSEEKGSSSQAVDAPTWPKIVCPKCNIPVIHPRERLKILFSVGGLFGTCLNGCALKMQGNNIFSYVVAIGFFVLAGRLWSTGFSFIFTLLFFFFGVFAMVWGINTSQIVVTEERLHET
jgi:hypothetical protein